MGVPPNGNLGLDFGKGEFLPLAHFHLVFPFSQRQQRESPATSVDSLWTRSVIIWLLAGKRELGNITLLLGRQSYCSLNGGARREEEAARQFADIKLDLQQ